MAHGEAPGRRTSRTAAGVLLAAGLAASPVLAGAAGSGTGGSATEDLVAEDLVYVTNQGEASVAVVDAGTLEVVETVDLQELGYSENARPHHVVAEPDGSAWYVSLIGENAVLKFDGDNELVGEVTFEAAGLLALHPARDELYVARSMTAVDPPRSLGVAERSDFALLEEIDVLFPRPHAVALPRDGRFLLSASLATNQLIGVDTETGRGELSVVEGPTHVIVQIAASPSEEVAVATGQMTGELIFFDLEEDGRLLERESVAVGAQPWHPVYGPEGERIYVPNKQSNSVSVVDAESRRVVETIEDPSFAQPHGAAISADGRYLFVSNNHQPMMMEQVAVEMAAGAEAPPPPEEEPRHDHDADEEHPGTLSVIDLETLEVVEEITVGMYATGVGTRAR